MSYFFSRATGGIFDNVDFINPKLRTTIDNYVGAFCAFCSNLKISNSKVENIDLENSSATKKGYAGAFGGGLVNSLIFRGHATGEIKKYNSAVGGFVVRFIIMD